MNVRGQVINGVVVLEKGTVLPEGAAVTVSCSDVDRAAAKQTQRIRLPLVPSNHPGSISLTSERVAELLDEADVSA